MAIGMTFLRRRTVQYVLSMLLVAASSPCSGQPSLRAPRPVALVGEFSNEVVHDVSGDPHVSGYSLVLFRQADRLFGNFYAIDAEAGDSPNGRIENVRVDPRTRRLAFTAKLTTGSIYDAASGTESPAWDWFEFDGRLPMPSRLVGTIVLKDGHDLGAQKKWHAQQVVLKRRHHGYAPTQLPASYESWLATPLSNGPQW